MAKKEKDDFQPSIFGSLLVAAVAIMVGIILATINLSLIAVAEVKEIPPDDESDVKVVYYVKGETKGGKNWETKRTYLEAGTPGSIFFDEGELNTWLRKTFSSKQIQKPNSGEEDKGEFLKIAATNPNVNIDGIDFQLSSVIEVPLYFKKFNIVYQTKGIFVKDDTGYNFVPEKSYFGSCPIPKLFGIQNRVFKIFSSDYLISEEYVALNTQWSELDVVSVENDMIKLVIPGS